MTAAQAGLMVKSLGATAAASAATRALPSQFAAQHRRGPQSPGRSLAGGAGGSVPGGASRRRRAPLRQPRRAAAVAGRRRPGRPVPSEAGQVPLPADGDDGQEAPT